RALSLCAAWLLAAYPRRLGGGIVVPILHAGGGGATGAAGTGAVGRYFSLGANDAHHAADPAALSFFAGVGSRATSDRRGLCVAHAGTGPRPLGRPRRHAEGPRASDRRGLMSAVETLEAAPKKPTRDPTTENFPVASIFLRPHHRAVILAFYAFARQADDIAD